MSSVKVEVLAHRSCSSTGEGPFWESNGGKLTYVDIVSGDIHQYCSQTATDTKFHVGEGTVSLVIPRHTGGYVIGYNKTLSHYDLSTGRSNPLLEVEHKKDNRFNDGKCDRTGRLYAGTMARNTSADPLKLRENDAALYSLERNGSLVKRVDKISLSNGLAWSSDNKTMYYIDSMPRTIYAFDYDADSGELTNQRVVKQFAPDTMEQLGFPDGMTIDTDDNIWVASYNGGRVTKWDPKTGTMLQEVEIPGARRITSCCFGGQELDELYVTSCAYDFTEDDYKQQPNGGSLFKVTGLGVKGTPSLPYLG